jgi:CHAT domain-containing protein
MKLFSLFLLFVVGSVAEPVGNRSFAEAERLRSEQREAATLQAIDKYADAAEYWRHNGNPQQVTTALRNAGELLQLVGNTSNALAQYVNALALSRKTGNQIEEGRILNDLAYLHFIAGDTKEAHQNSLAALRIGKSLGNREIEAEALSNLGEAFYSLGEVAKAQVSQTQSLEIWRELGNQRGQAIASVALGYYYVNLGQPERALKSYEDGLSLARAANDLSVEAFALIAVGNIKRKRGENQDALEAYKRAQPIAERIGDKTSQATILGGMGSVYSEMGDKRKSLELIEETTRLMERTGKKWGTAEGKLELGRIHHSLGDYEKALEYLNEALTLFRSLSMDRFESATLRAIGLVHSARGDTANALKSFHQALRKTHKGEDQLQEAYTLNYIGEVYERLQQPKTAVSYYNRSLELSRRSADPGSEARCLYDLAHVERDRGDLPEARRHIEAALKIVESLRTKVVSQDLRTSYFATIRNTYDLYIDILMLLDKANPGSGYNAEAFAASERARARSFLESLREARANVREGVDPELLSRERQLNETLNTKAQFQLQLLAKKQKDEADKLSKEIDSLTAELAQVRDQIKATSPRYADLTLPEPLKLHEVQQRVLDDDSILLEYALGDDRSYVWLATRTEVFSYELPPRAEIEASARRLYNLFVSYQLVYGEPLDDRVARRAKADAEIPGEIATLSKLVLGPFAGKLDKKRLLVIADGALQYIPFQALLTAGSQQSLIATHEIVNEPSASTLALLLSEAASRRSAANSVAVLADPVFDVDDPRVKRTAGTPAVANDTIEVRQALRDIGISPDGVLIPRLLASADEADGIIAAAPRGTGLKAVGFAANRARVLSPELSSYRIVHFATHGMINSERPELSGIVLSLFDDEGRSQNGFLRLHDIYNLRLPADLVVLSACSTGLGKDVRGEGLIGLTRGFMYAGAAGVVASLWKVDDEATAQLMKYFYEALFNKGMSPAAALRDAQLALSQHKRWQSPYYWAGFVIQGNFDEQHKFASPWLSRNQITVLAVVGGTLLLVATMVLIRRRRRNV